MDWMQVPADKLLEPKTEMVWSVQTGYGIAVHNYLIM